MEVGIRKVAWRRAWRYPAYLWSLRWVYAVKKTRRLVYAVYPRIPPNTPLATASCIFWHIFDSQGQIVLFTTSTVQSTCSGIYFFQGGDFEFFCPKGLTLHWWWWNLAWRVDSILQGSALAYPLHDFCKIFRDCGELHGVSHVKIGEICLRGSTAMVFKFEGVQLTQIFIIP